MHSEELEDYFFSVDPHAQQGEVINHQQIPPLEATGPSPLLDLEGPFDEDLMHFALDHSANLLDDDLDDNSLPPDQHAPPTDVIDHESINPLWPDTQNLFEHTDDESIEIPQYIKISTASHPNKMTKKYDKNMKAKLILEFYKSQIKDKTGIVLHKIQWHRLAEDGIICWPDKTKNIFHLPTDQLNDRYTWKT